MVYKYSETWVLKEKMMTEMSQSNYTLQGDLHHL